MPFHNMAKFDMFEEYPEIMIIISKPQRHSSRYILKKFLIRFKLLKCGMYTVKWSSYKKFDEHSRQVFIHATYLEQYSSNNKRVDQWILIFTQKI